MMEIRPHLWQMYYSLQSVGLVQPIVIFLFMANAARTAEDKKAVRRWLVKKTVQFIGLFILTTAVLTVLQVLGVIDLNLKADR